MPAERIRLLLVDDEPGYLDEMAVGLSSYFDVDTAADGRAALDLVADRHGRYDVALIDQHLGSEPDGITLLSRIRQTYPDIEGIVLTGYAAEDRERAVAAGAFGYVMITDLPQETRGVDADPLAGGDRETLADEELAELLSSGSPEKIRAALPRMSPEMKRLALAVLQEK